MGMRSCAIAVHFRPRGFALPLLVALPLVCPHPYCNARFTPTVERLELSLARQLVAMRLA